MASFLVALPQDVAEQGKRYLTERGYRLCIGRTGMTQAELMAFLAPADAILVRNLDLPAAVLAAAPRLRVIGRHGVGVDQIDLDYCRAHGIAVTNAPLSNALAVAEHTIGMMVAVAHNFARGNEGVKRGDFAVRERMCGVDLEGKTLGVVGLGRIGRLVAEKARAAFHMRVLAYGPRLTQGGCPPGVEAAPLARVIAEADVLSLHAPLNAQTRALVNAATLARMKRGAMLVNCARGELVDEDALAGALCAGHLRGAALDVLCREPPAPDCPLLRAPNLLITPHNASHSEEALARMAVDAAMGIDDVLSGRQPRWRVV